MSLDFSKQVEMYQNMSVALDYSPVYLSTQSPWHGLIPLGYWLTLMTKPRVIYELGSYRGDSFFTFYHASKSVDLSKIVAVDTWEGDHNTGNYGAEPFQQFCAEMERLGDPRIEYARMLFDECVEKVPDSTIDLLHIDGAHDYDSVLNDFERWTPKLSKKGIMLFHDTAVFKEGFGVYKLWEELLERYPGRCFSTSYSNGLGVYFAGEYAPHWLLKDEYSASLRFVLKTLESSGEYLSKSVEVESDYVNKVMGQVPSDWIFNRFISQNFLMQKSSFAINRQFENGQFADEIFELMKAKFIELVDSRLAEDSNKESLTDDYFELMKSKLIDLVDSRLAEDSNKESLTDAYFELMKDKLTELVDSRLSDESNKANLTDAYFELMKDKFTELVNSRLSEEADKASFFTNM